MTWRCLRLDHLPRRSLGRTTARLQALGTAGVEERPATGDTVVVRQPWDTGPVPPPMPKVQLVAWFEDPNEEALLRRLGALPAGVVPLWEDVQEEDWESSWKAGFEPLQVSPRLLIAPPWDPREGALIIEPGQGFGTGQHPTTQQALRALDRLTGEGGTALDVGCGSGILALAAHRLGLQVWGIDNDPTAVIDALAQAALNGVTDARFDTTPVEEVEGVWDLVLANLFAETLVTMAPELIRLTGRHLILAGILVDREALVREVYDPLLGEPERDADESWVSLVYRGRA